MRLIEVVETSAAVAAESGRKAKTETIAALLADRSPDEAALVVGFLTGDLRQGRVGIGFAALRDLPDPTDDEPSLTIDAIDETIDRIQATTGAGSRAKRAALLEDLYIRATAPEQEFLTRLLLGDLKQGALDGVMIEAVAKANGIPATVVRRAHMLQGDLRRVAAIAADGGRQALASVGLRVLRPIQPMLAQSAETTDDAWERAAGAAGAVAVEWKLDGARIQVHKQGSEVRAFTRNLNEMTDRVPDVIGLVSSLEAESVILDGEVIRLRADGRPLPFQETMSQFGREADNQDPVEMTPFFFDLIHLDGTDLLDEAATDRLAALDQLVPVDYRAPRVIAARASEAKTFFDDAVAAGHEGVMVKALDAPYAAGRRGVGWIKVKPVHTLDLVVLAAEWGHGRRSGYLSNLHLGARDPQTGGWVMLGKTFKGLTDEMLAWQTERLQELRSDTSASDWVDPRGSWVVYVRPELMVEIALDGVQESSRYPGGMALRFARVKGYRPDKDPGDADTVDTVRALFESSRA